VRVLIVGFPHSVHTARGIELTSGLGWDVHLFPSTPGMSWGLHPGLRDVTIHLDPSWTARELHPSVRVERLEVADEPVSGWLDRAPRARALAGLIRDLGPDVVHSKEIQHAGYTTLAARRSLDGSFPPWLMSNWGSDIYYYARNPRHLGRIKAVLRACDYYRAECHRDVALARALGFRGRALPVLPNAGGYDLDLAAGLRQPGRTSERRTIALKAKRAWVYRPVTAIRALERCREALTGYRLGLYWATEEIRDAAQRACSTLGLELDVLSGDDVDLPHEEILALHGRSRVSVSLSVSDAICTSFLDALVMGSFPVQSNTSCAPEWARHRRGAVFVPPDDSDRVAAALRLALTDDQLVDRAAEINLRTARQHLDRELIRARWVDAYERIGADSVDRAQSKSRAGAA
jgi:glycosyltransferase involved in cell wall biosynthesis